MTTVGREKNHGFITKKHIKALIVDNMEDGTIKDHVLEYIENLVNSHNDLIAAHKKTKEELEELKIRRW